MRATRSVRGAASLSSSSHLPAIDWNRLVVGQAQIEPRVAALDPSRFRQPFTEGAQSGLNDAIRFGATDQHPDPPHPPILLRARCERPARGRAANNLHEITPSHCRPRSKTTLFGIQLPSSKQKIASTETGLNA